MSSSKEEAVGGVGSLIFQGDPGKKGDGWQTMLRLDLEEAHYLELASDPKDRNRPETIRRCLREAAMRNAAGELWVKLHLYKPPLFPKDQMRPVIVPAHIADKRARHYLSLGWEAEVSAVGGEEEGSTSKGADALLMEIDALAAELSSKIYQLKEAMVER